MEHQTAMIKNGQPITVLLSCVDPGLEQRLAHKLTSAGYCVIQEELNFLTLAHRIFQLRASLLIFQTNTGRTYEKEVEYCHLLRCKVLHLETHAIFTDTSEQDIRKPDARMTLPVDMDGVLGMIQCLFYGRKPTETTHLSVMELLDRWQVTRRQPNRSMMEQTILLTMENPHWMMHITKYIYPRLAQRNHLTVTAVEQRLRRAINRIYNYSQDELFRSLFEEHPSNSVFFTRVAWYLSHCDQEEKPFRENVK